MTQRIDAFLLQLQLLERPQDSGTTEAKLPMRKILLLLLSLLLVSVILAESPGCKDHKHFIESWLRNGHITRTYEPSHFFRATHFRFWGCLNHSLQLFPIFYLRTVFSKQSSWSAWLMELAGVVGMCLTIRGFARSCVYRSYLGFHENGQLDGIRSFAQNILLSR